MMVYVEWYDSGVGFFVLVFWQDIGKIGTVGISSALLLDSARLAGELGLGST
jgi:hypothetical protein